MKDYRKYACEISGVLFKEVNRKGIRRDRLAKELKISVNQIKNYAYDSTKSATLENFLQILITYKCQNVLNLVAADMGCCVYRLPDVQNPQNPTEAASDALAQTARAVAACLTQSGESGEQEIMTAIEKLLSLAKTVKTGD